MDLSSESKPILRWPLDIQHLELKGQAMLLIRDPYEVCDKPAAVPEVLLPIIARFNGSNTISGIAAEGEHVGLTEEVVQQVAKLLLDLDLLDTPHTRHKFEQIKSDFRNCQLRELSHAGLVYPTDTNKLIDQLNSYLDQSPQGLECGVNPEDVLVVFSPHIDYQRGWHAYAHMHRLLLRLPKPDVLFLIGTTHQPSQFPFVLTDKAFATPFGTLPPAEAVISSIAARYGPDRSFGFEILHKQEHSLELLLPFIGHAFCDETPPKIVPILIGSFHQYVCEHKLPNTYSEVDLFITGMVESISQLRNAGKRVLIICGVDLAHMGRNFGDSEQIAPHGLGDIELEDQKLLNAILSGSSSRVFEHIANDEDRRRVCGFPTLYTVLNTLEQANIKVEGTDFGYKQAADEESDCIVTFFTGCLSEVGK